MRGTTKSSTTEPAECEHRWRHAQDGAPVATWLGMTKTGIGVAVGWLLVAVGLGWGTLGSGDRSTPLASRSAPAFVVEGELGHRADDAERRALCDDRTAGERLSTTDPFARRRGRTDMCGYVGGDPVGFLEAAGTVRSVVTEMIRSYLRGGAEAYPENRARQLWWARQRAYEDREANHPYSHERGNCVANEQATALAYAEHYLYARYSVFVNPRGPNVGSLKYHALLAPGYAVATLFGRNWFWDVLEDSTTSASVDSVNWGIIGARHAVREVAGEDVWIDE